MFLEIKVSVDLSLQFCDLIIVMSDMKIMMMMMMMKKMTPVQYARHVFKHFTSI